MRLRWWARASAEDIHGIHLNDERVTVFTISPRTTNVAEYWHNIELCIDWSSRYGATGILLFEGNDTFVSVWVAGQAAFERSKTLSPLVAVNPIYMHPFAVAKLVNSYAQTYGRKTYLNMIAGTALSHQQELDDILSHDERYERLGEYAGADLGVADDGRAGHARGQVRQGQRAETLSADARGTAP